MSPRFHRFRLLLDEGLYPRKSLPRINSRHNIKHIKHDLKRGGVRDKEIYEIAIKQRRIIVTYNIRDFKKLARLNKNAGVIGVGQNFTPEQLDIKLNSLLSRSSEKAFYGKYTPLNKNKY
ncbi:MAG: DUF5615 family PIN-like protein [Candidatus Levybacteria bacterium]|nr:DUF5615 family PIN-like protein [Candidatus Levybacteria bacterium]